MQRSNEQLEQMREVDPPPSLIQQTLLPDLDKNLAPGRENLYDSLVKIAGAGVPI